MTNSHFCNENCPTFLMWFLLGYFKNDAADKNLQFLAPIHLLDMELSKCESNLSSAQVLRCPKCKPDMPAEVDSFICFHPLVKSSTDRYGLTVLIFVKGTRFS